MPSYEDNDRIHRGSSVLDALRDTSHDSGELPKPQPEQPYGMASKRAIDRLTEQLKRETFVVPPGHIHEKDAEGRATGWSGSMTGGEWTHYLGKPATVQQLMQRNAVDDAKAPREEKRTAICICEVAQSFGTDSDIFVAAHEALTAAGFEPCTPVAKAKPEPEALPKADFTQVEVALDNIERSLSACRQALALAKVRSA